MTTNNKYLEKIAGEKMKGFISPAWMEADIAKQHGKQSPDGFWRNMGAHLKGNFRASGRSLVDGVVGGVGGATAGHALDVTVLKKTPVGKLAGGVIGAYAGSGHGIYKSLKNQAKEMHDKYRTKEAGLNLSPLAKKVGAGALGGAALGGAFTSKDNTKKGLVGGALAGAALGALGKKRPLMLNDKVRKAATTEVMDSAGRVINPPLLGRK